MMPSISHRYSIAVMTIAIGVATATTPGRAAQSAAQVAPATASLAELWEDPGDVAARDLRWGRGGRELAPPVGAEYTFKNLDTAGYSPGYDVADASGRKWKVKTGDEAQPEVVVSRVLWAVGYRQPIMYFIPEWRLKGGPVTRPMFGRFRLSSDHTTISDWSWTQNPFLGTRELRGLVVVNLLLNNWDLKSSQNRIYSVQQPPMRWFVVQDVGASLGKTSWPTGSKLKIEDFESQNLITGVENGRVVFDYHARHKELMEDITPADVVWICQLLNRITETQWNDVFGHVGIPGDKSARYIQKIRSKIREGLSLSPQTAVRR